MFRLLQQVGDWSGREQRSVLTQKDLKATTHKARRGGLRSFSAWTLPSGSKDARVQLAVGCG